MQTVRELEPSDVEAFREIRLEGLRLHPDAFGSVHAVEAKETLADFAAKIVRGGLFGGFVEGRLEGMAGFGVSSAAQLSHKGILGGMYVREALRGSGLAEAIVKTVLAHAGRRVEQVQLSVAATNERAIRFYRRLGFQAYATEPRALKVGQTYIDELLMVRFLGE
ncbi:acyl-CoA acyltransferase [Bradyrhizobium nitroreducens]|uniref:Acyl-CoA acyltransferase n=1 Tax=Bradyrhizobium nitroreducens TaxID=709803 RepID=A0A2N9WJN1_9BRAD|nr:GNAT family N-acetyltransferase [Bradyrhizobium nitroreducens]PIT06525.1 acyl-CoA acyltransferase [Bradyrhizobium nitroreducens]